MTSFGDVIKLRNLKYVKNFFIFKPSLSKILVALLDLSKI